MATNRRLLEDVLYVLKEKENRIFNSAEDGD